MLGLAVELGVLNIDWLLELKTLKEPVLVTVAILPEFVLDAHTGVVLKAYPFPYICEPAISFEIKQLVFPALSTPCIA